LMTTATLLDPEPDPPLPDEPDFAEEQAVSASAAAAAAATGRVQDFDDRCMTTPQVGSD
jgi:hypothetical protein